MTLKRQHSSGCRLVRLLSGSQGHRSATHLAGFSAVLQAEAYAGFNALYENGVIKGCMLHPSAAQSL